MMHSMYGRFALSSNLGSRSHSLTLSISAWARLATSGWRIISSMNVRIVVVVLLVPLDYRMTNIRWHAVSTPAERQQTLIMRASENLNKSLTDVQCPCSHLDVIFLLINVGSWVLLKLLQAVDCKGRCGHASSLYVCNKCIQNPERNSIFRTAYFFSLRPFEWRVYH